MKPKFLAMMLLFTTMVTSNFVLAQSNPSADKNLTITVNGESFDMVYVEGGTFQMGATPEQGDEPNEWEKPVHAVTLDSYYIGKFEVTQKLWKAVMGNYPQFFYGKDPNLYGDDLPVVCVNRAEAQEFVKKLSEFTGKKFHLPTEAEWEFAARGGNKSRGYKFSGSNNIDDVAWYGEEVTKGLPHSVGSKKPNELGIYDMSGNVWEWVQDNYIHNYYSISPSKNPCAKKKQTYNIIRGGSFFGKETFCRVAYRNIYFGHGSSYEYGSRIAL